MTMTSDEATVWEGRLQLVGFETTEGGKAWVNPKYVECLEERTVNQGPVTMIRTSAWGIRVNMTGYDVLRRLNSSEAS